MSVFFGCANIFKGKRSVAEVDNIIMTADNRTLQKTAGYLEKRGKLIFMNSWKKYWFVLDGHLLLFYGSKDDYDLLSPCRGSITLEPTSTVKPYTAVPIAFQITTRSTTITLRAQSVSEQTKWIQAFISTLNQNHNINKSSTKLNHFRYSSETLDKLADNKEDVSSTPTGSPHGKSPQDTPKSGESPLIDRLQKLGARSYNFSVQQQIMEGVRLSRERSFVKDTAVECTRKDVNVTEINALKDVELLSKKKLPHIVGNKPKVIERTKKMEDIILDDEDFCVCNLGKEESQDEKLQTVEEEQSSEILSEKSFALKSHMLKQQGHTEDNHRQKNNSDSPQRTKFTEAEIVYSNIPVYRQRKSRENFHSDSNYDENMENKHALKNKSDAEPEPPRVGSQVVVYENVEIVPEIHGIKPAELLHENKEISNPIHPKTIHDRKATNNQNLYSKSDQTNLKFQLHEDPKQKSTLKNNCEISTPTYAEPIKERKLENIPNLHAMKNESNAEFESPLVGSKVAVYENVEIVSQVHGMKPTELLIESREISNPIHAKTMHDRKVANIQNSFSKSEETDLKFHLNEELKRKSNLEDNCAISSPTYAEPIKEPKLKNNLNLLIEPKDRTSTSGEKQTFLESIIENKNYSGSKEVMDDPNLLMKTNPMLRYIECKDQKSPLEKSHNIKPNHMKPGIKSPSLTETETTAKNKCKIPVPTYAEPNKERKLKNMINSGGPEDNILSIREKINTEAKRALSNSDMLTTGEKNHHKESMNYDLKFHSCDKTSQEKTSEMNIRKPVSHIYDELDTEKNLETIEHIYTEPEYEAINIETTTTKSGKNFQPFLKSKAESFFKNSDNSGPFYSEPIKNKKLKNIQQSSEFQMTDNVIYAASNTEFTKPVNCGKNWFMKNEKSIRTEELECEMDLSEEGVDEFECDNDLYGSTNKLFNTPTELSGNELYKEHNETFTKNRRREFQFPPPPKLDDDAIDAASIVTESTNERCKKSKNIENTFKIQEEEFELENDLYAGVKIENNNHQSAVEKYPEYEEPEIICDNAIYAEPNLGFTQTSSSGKPEEVEYSIIPDVDEKTDHHYNEPFEKNLNDSNLYEDPEKFHVENKEEKPMKSRKKNRRQKSEPSGKAFKMEETKKNDGFILKFFRQAAKKQSDKCDEYLADGEMDDSLIMLTEIQQILEKKKKIIEAMAVHCRNKEAAKSLLKSDPSDLDKKGRAKSYPSRSPDLLKDLNKRPVFNSDFPGLSDEYSTVQYDTKNEGDNIYSEVASESGNFERKKQFPIKSEKFNSWTYDRESSND